MIIAKLSNGTLLLGVTRENINRLTDGKPIRVSQATHGVKMPDEMPIIGIFFGETEQECIAQIQSAETMPN